MGMDEVTGPPAREPGERERQRRRRPVAPDAVGPRPWRGNERHGLDVDAVEHGGPKRRRGVGQPVGQSATSRDLDRRHRPAERQHPHLRAGIARCHRLPVCPYSVNRISRRRVPLGDYDDTHEWLSTVFGGTATRLRDLTAGRMTAPCSIVPRFMALKQLGVGSIVGVIALLLALGAPQVGARATNQGSPPPPRHHGVPPLKHHLVPG